MTTKKNSRLNPWMAALLVALMVAIITLPGSAATAAVGQLTTPQVEANGASTTTSDVLVVLQENTLPEHIPGSPVFHLEASQLRVETDQSDLALGPLVELRTDSYTTIQEHLDASVTGLAHRGNYRFSVWPLDGSPITASLSQPGCTEVTAASQDRIERRALVHTLRDSNTAATGAGLEWTACSPSHVTLRGDFLLRLWEWDAELRAPGIEPVLLESGKRNLDGTPQEPGVEGFAGKATEQYLYAHNATLTIPALSGSHAVLLRDASVEVRQVALPTATGFLLGHSLSGDSVLLTGNALRVGIHGTGAGALDVAVAGQVDHLQVNGVTVAVVAEGPGVESGMILLLLAAGAVMGVGVAALVLARSWLLRKARGHGLPGGYASLRAMPPRRRARQLQDTAFRHHAARANHAAIWCVNQAIRLEPDDPDPYALRGRCHASLGHRRRALRDFREAHARCLDPESAAAAAYRVSRLYGQCQRASEASHWLAIAATWNPDYLAQATIEPDYACVADHPTLRSLLGRHSSPGSAASDWGSA